MNRLFIPICLIALAALVAAGYYRAQFARAQAQLVITEVPTAITEKESSGQHSPEPTVGITDRTNPSPIENLLADKDPQVRLHALHLLALKHPERFEEQLPGLLSTKDGALCRAALSSTSSEAAVKHWSRILELTTVENAEIRRKAVEIMGDAAQSESLQDQQVAIGDALLKALKREEEAYRAQNKKVPMGVYVPYIHAMAKVNDAAARKRVLQFLRHPEYTLLRKSAAVALLGHVGVESDKALVAAWKFERDPGVRADIERILVKEPFNYVVDRKAGSLQKKESTSQ